MPKKKKSEKNDSALFKVIMEFSCAVCGIATVYGPENLENKKDGEIFEVMCNYGHKFKARVIRDKNGKNVFKLL
jgi:hypothetical protein